jgi:CRISPR-associated protein Cas2
MRVLISYDIRVSDETGKRRLRRVAKLCESFGVRVQYSVFECSLGDAELVRLRASLLRAIDESADSLRIYRLGDDDAARTEHHGVREPLDLDGPLVV